MIRKPLSIVRQIFVIILFLTACQPAVTTPTAAMEPARTATATAPMVFTETPTAIPTQVPPTLTPESPPDLVTPTVQAGPTATPNPLSFHPRQRWLAYHSGANHFMVVNQDGSGLVRLTDPSLNSQERMRCDTGEYAMIAENPLTRMELISGALYLIHPPYDIRVIRRSSDHCRDLAYTGDDQSGLLAMIRRETADAIPELIIFELPSGKVRDRFPLVRCSVGIECNYQDVVGWQVRWSPNGRYLAFPAMWASPTTDLYMYDARARSTRQLASSPDSVSQLWWSPGGSWVIMGETPDPTFFGTTSLWVASIQGNDFRRISAIPSAMPQGILGWAERTQFIAYDGFTGNALEVAQNLRLVNLAGQTQMLFDGAFVEAELDDTRKVIALYVLSQEKYEQGTYLISVSDPTPRFLTPHQLTWDEDLKLFVIPDDLPPVPCQGDPGALQAFDRTGTPRCIKPPKLPQVDTYPSPNFRWKVLLQGGVSLIATASGARQSVSPDPATQVIWCPDSTCFFYVAGTALVRVSVPVLAVDHIDNQLPPGRQAMDFYWLEP